MKMNENSFIKMIFFIITLILYIAIARGQAAVITGNEVYDKVIFTSEKVTIHTNDSLRYIGKTKNYIFFYNKYSKISFVYDFNSVKELSVHENTISEFVSNQFFH